MHDAKINMHGISHPDVNSTLPDCLFSPAPSLISPQVCVLLIML